MEELTAKQQQVFHYIRRYLLQKGYAPTELEIAQHALEQGSSMSRRIVRQILQHLEQSGHIRILPRKKRSIRLTDEKSLFRQLPIIGKIAAGNPIEPLKTDEVLDLTDLMIGPNRYVLQVTGDSMSGDNICDGDYIICERCDHAENGDIVVALLNNKEIALKRLQKNEDATITLLSSNKNLEPMLYPREQVKIQGVYLGLIRLPTLPEGVFTAGPPAKKT